MGSRGRWWNCKIDGRGPEKDGGAVRVSFVQ